MVHFWLIARYRGLINDLSLRLRWRLFIDLPLILEKGYVHGAISSDFSAKLWELHFQVVMERTGFGSVILRFGSSTFGFGRFDVRYIMLKFDQSWPKYVRSSVFLDSFDHYFRGRWRAK